MADNKRCILVSVNEDISELKDLSKSMNFKIENIFVQLRKSPDPKYYIGRGKTQEISDYIKDNNIDIAIYNTLLKPSQQYNIESFLKIMVYDRIRLILEIFSDRAHSEEARLQVELAKLHYEIPLLRDWIHKARYGERPGFMAGGEYEVAQYYEISKKRIKKIKQRLKKVEKGREIQRKQRKTLGYHLISIVGYTNAGKSTLFNLLSGEKVSVEDRLFTTLSTTTRKIPNIRKSIILTDTVGLIDNLPHWLIEAFHSTLEEIFLSDVIILIVDASEPISEIKRKISTAFEVLLPDIEPSDIILLFNKIDKVEGIFENQDYRVGRGDVINRKLNDFMDKIGLEYVMRYTLAISAIQKEYKDTAIKIILKTLKYPKHISITLPNISSVQSFISWLHTNCDILSINYKQQIQIDFRYREKDEDHIIKSINELNGKIL